MPIPIFCKVSIPEFSISLGFPQFCINVKRIEVGSNWVLDESTVTGSGRTGSEKPDVVSVTLMNVDRRTADRTTR